MNSEEPKISKPSNLIRIQDDRNDVLDLGAAKWLISARERDEFCGWVYSLSFGVWLDVTTKKLSMR